QRGIVRARGGEAGFDAARRLFAGEAGGGGGDQGAGQLKLRGGGGSYGGGRARPQPGPDRTYWGTTWTVQNLGPSARAWGEHTWPSRATQKRHARGAHP